MGFQKLFKEKIKGEQNQESLNRMNKQLRSVGGTLNFTVKTDKEGWFAICKEFPAIVTGGKDLNPTEDDMSLSIIDSVKTAFHVPINNLEKEKKSKQPSIKTIKQERIMQFSI